MLKTGLFTEAIHDNCHDYLKPFYIEIYSDKRFKVLLYEIASRVDTLNICTELSRYDYEKVVLCDQHAFVTGRGDSNKPLLATYGINVCMSLILYAPGFNVGCVSHFDGLPGYSKESATKHDYKLSFSPVKRNIDAMLSSVRKCCNAKGKILVDFYLVGGIFNMSEVMLHDILEYLASIQGKEYQLVFKGRNIMGPENQARNVCLDTRCGSIRHYDIIISGEYNVSPMIEASNNSEALLDATWSC